MKVLALHTLASGTGNVRSLADAVLEGAAEQGHGTELAHLLKDLPEPVNWLQIGQSAVQRGVGYSRGPGDFDRTGVTSTANRDGGGETA